MILTLLAFIVVLGVVIFVHELGHFIAAKLVGIRVETFSLGFPPKMVSKKIGETEYVIAWIPLGGYVKMSGMVDESMDDKPLTGASWEFMSKNYLQKIFVITAGVMMNFLLGIIVYFLLTWNIGIAEPNNEPVAGYVPDGYPAAEIGIEIGDRIVAVDGDSIITWTDLTDAIHPRADDTISVSWLHEGEIFSATVVPVLGQFMQGDSAIEFGRIGINPQVDFTEVGIFKAFGNGVRLTGFIITESLKVLKMLIFGKANINELAGPIGIAQISGQTIRSGFIDYISLIAQISVSIGLLNILPFPVLDGGHIIFISVEAVIRRQISSKIKLNIQKVGLALILAFFLIVSYNDIIRVLKTIGQ
ncbi:RIP metalloprotease RseP [candidate division LCP-89 bacterium B3_LCP]|uniref:Zinc metalloprotease n=1 Tax=candidate division LCP-89 bacterium B3_LCP TaxID=2012998 RepID=A0A532UY21_UNCL8|nr:MAG: RIP metalloprotease RseP [candidate division LCP-89 bacterium B3_LCP]